MAVILCGESFFTPQVFVSSIESREKECQHSTSLDLLMSDDAEDWVLSHASIPRSGTFRRSPVASVDSRLSSPLVATASI